MPVALQRWVLQVECTYTLLVDSPMDLSAGHLLYNTGGLTSLFFLTVSYISCMLLSSVLETGLQSRLRLGLQLLGYC